MLELVLHLIELFVESSFLNHLPINSGTKFGIIIPIKGSDPTVIIVTLVVSETSNNVNHSNVL